MTMSIHDHIIGLADKPQVKPPKISDPKVDSVLKDYVEVPKLLVGASKWAVDAWERLGRPQSPFTENGVKLMEVIIAMWEELDPQEAKRWYADRAEYQKEELDVSTQVQKHTGGSLASFPYMIFGMMKKFWPDVKVTGPNGRATCKKLCRRFPMFRMSKYRS